MEKISGETQNKELNGTTIWILSVYGPLIFVLIFYFIFNNFVNHAIKTGDTTSLENIDGLMTFLAIIYSIIFLILDRKFLKNNNAIAPSGWWFFLFPVYVFRRQYLNNAGLHIFWIYLVMNWVFPPVAYRVIAHVVMDSLR